MKHFLDQLGITKKEWWIVGITSVFIMMITIIPILLVWLWTPKGEMYLGIHAFTPGDYNVYFSYIEQVRQGHFLLKDLFTSELQTRHLFNPFWIIVGILAKTLNLSNIMALQTVRLALVLFFATTVYILIAYFLKTPRQRLAAFFLILFAGGWGGLLAPFLQPFRFESGGYYHWPPDLWVSEATGWLTMYNAPHIMASTILMILFVLTILLVTDTGRISLARRQRFIMTVIVGIATALWFVFHPFHIVSMTAMVAVYWFYVLAYKRKTAFESFPHLLLLGVLASPGILYNIWLLRTDPLAAGRAAQNECLTPVLWLLIIGYGALFFGAVIGIRAIVKKKYQRHAFLVIWFVVQFIVIYLPFINYQRRMIQGWYLPMSILTVIGFTAIRPWLKEKIGPTFWPFVANPGTVIALSAIFLFMSSFYTVASDIYIFRNPPKNVVYKNETWKDVTNWIKQETSEDAVFLAGTINGSFLPAWTGRTVYLGHGVETVQYPEKLRRYFWFLSAEGSRAEKLDFLKTYRIDYIFYSSEEQKIGPLDTDIENDLEKVFEKGEFTIYKVRYSS